MLAGIVEHRAAVASVVRRERRGYDQPIPDDIDIDVSLYGTLPGFGDAAGADKRDHRRLAMEARAELWKNIREGEVSNAEEDDEATQTWEEMAHTE
jgi:hypothetical protein